MDIFSQLKRDEGMRHKPYRDTVGKLTIGVGRNLDDNGISEAEANYLLGNDVAMVTSALRQRFGWVDGLGEVRFGVLQNMGFNMGIERLLMFHNMLSFLQQNRFDEAALQMENSVWYREVGDRAKRLTEQMRTGEWK
jgi:lysozyme